MRRTLNIIFIVFCGVVGAWVGYWIGHLAGWSENADWPGTIGGGSGAVLLSIGVSVLFVALAGLVVFLVPEWRVRRVLRRGAEAEATVVRVHKTGGRSRGFGAVKHQVVCELEVCPEGGTPYRARTTQFLAETVQTALRPGARVTVRVDPARPTRVAIEGPLVPAAG